MDIRCLVSRHLDVVFVIGCGLEAGWYHAGSCVCRLGDRQIAARVALCFLAVLSILLISWFKSFERGPLSGACQDCRKVFIHACLVVLGGVVVSIKISVILAHFGHAGVRFRYAFSHMISMASFLALMLSRLSPPSWMG